MDPHAACNTSGVIRRDDIISAPILQVLSAKVGSQHEFRGSVPSKVHLARRGGACPKIGISGINLVYYKPVFFKIALLRSHLVNQVKEQYEKCE
jgi:hypothetical protein